MDPDEGPMHLLSCDHSIRVGNSKNASARRCPKCPAEASHAPAPRGPITLRAFLAAHYGWPNRAIKDISKISSWAIDGLDERPGNILDSDCRLFVRVIDDDDFVVFIGNTNIRSQVAPHLAALARNGGGYVCRTSQPEILAAIADAIDALTTPPYDTPSFKYVCPRTAGRLRLLAQKLLTYYRHPENPEQ